MSNKSQQQELLSEIDDLALIKSLDLLKENYQKYVDDVPDISIDRQILAAAQREILTPNKKETIKNSLWRKLSLPIYASATFAFTAIAINVLLPAPVRVPPGTAGGAVSVDIIDNTQLNKALVNQKTSEIEKTEKRNLLPSEMNRLQPLPKYPKTELELSTERMDNSTKQMDFNAPTNITIQLDIKEGTLSEQFRDELSEGNSISTPDREMWAREIINLYKNGEHQKAQLELKRFKETFIDFPIDEQIEALR